MTRSRCCAALLLLLIAAPVSAEPRFALPTASGRQAAVVASWGTVLAAVALDAKASWDCPDRRRCFVMQGARSAAVFGVVFGAKTLVHRLRPCAPDCGSDNPKFSFPSGHTAFAFSAMGGPHRTVAFTLSVATAEGRVLGGKHWASDTAAGAGIGWLASLIR